MNAEDGTFRNMRSPSFSATQSHRALHFPIPPFAAKRVQRASSVASMGDVETARGDGQSARSAAKLPYLPEHKHTQTRVTLCHAADRICRVLKERSSTPYSAHKFMLR